MNLHRTQQQEQHKPAIIEIAIAIDIAFLLNKIYLLLSNLFRLIFNEITDFEFRNYRNL